MANKHLSPLSSDILAEILGRVDGVTLAAANCASSDLHGVASEERLWEALCHAQWPSTQGTVTHNLISSIGGFAKFYADSYPSIVYRKQAQIQSGSPDVSPSDFVSLVDVHYKEKCIFSKVLQGFPGINDAYNDTGGVGKELQWFLCCPFRVDALSCQYNDGITVDEYGYEEFQDDSIMEMLPFVLLDENDESNKLCKKLEENVRVSWVLLNCKNGKAVNLSSLKPVLVQRHWPSMGDFLMRFASVIPVEDQLLPCKLAESVISVKCQLKERQLRWTEISMQIEDIEGTYVDGRKSILILDRALRCERSIDGMEIERGYGACKKMKREVMQKKMKNDGVVDCLCLLSGITLFASLYLFVLP